MLSEQCSTCIGRPGNKMHLNPGRVKDMVQAAVQQGNQGIICHQTLPYGDHQDFGGALCRWFYDHYGHLTNFIRCMDRMGGFDEVAPPELGSILCYTSEPKAVSHQDPSQAERYSRMIPVVVAAGDTLSGIAAQYGVSYQSIASASGIANPNLIFAGETVEVPTGGGGTVSVTPTTPAWTPSPAPVQQEQPVSQASPSQVPSVTSSGFSIPGASQSLTNCIAFRESTNGTNPAANGNVFGIIPASGFNVAGDSLAQQEQVAGQILATTGPSAWSADGCPGT